MDHLDRARQSAARVDENANVPTLVAELSRKATIHALIDIAESLRALRPAAPDPKALRFGDRVVQLPTLVPLEDAQLEAVGGCDDDGDEQAS